MVRRRAWQGRKELSCERPKQTRCEPGRPDMGRKQTKMGCNARDRSTLSCVAMPASDATPSKRWGCTPLARGGVSSPGHSGVVLNTKSITKDLHVTEATRVADEKGQPSTGATRHLRDRPSPVVRERRPSFLGEIIISKFPCFPHFLAYFLYVFHRPPPACVLPLLYCTVYLPVSQHLKSSAAEISCDPLGLRYLNPCPMMGLSPGVRLPLDHFTHLFLLHI